MENNEFQILLDRMDNGFGSVYEKVDSLKDEFVLHREVCFVRFTNIEQNQAVKNALNNREKVAEKEKRTWSKWVIGTLLAMLTLVVSIIAGGRL